MMAQAEDLSDNTGRYKLLNAWTVWTVWTNKCRNSILLCMAWGAVDWDLFSCLS